MEQFNMIMDYVLRFLPGIIVAGLVLILLPKRNVELRIMSYILIFILTRDTMTPMHFWTFGKEGFFWIRFANLPSVLLFFGTVSFIMVISMNYLEKDLNKLLIYSKKSIFGGILCGFMGALIVVLPLLIMYQFYPIAQRGGYVPAKMLFPLLVITLLGNFYEETLFRGYFQGYMEKHTTPIKAAILSGLMFGFGHIFLAITVTPIGYPLIVFATYEGIIAALVRMKYGLIPATLTHGLAIFFLASGLI